MSNIQGFFVDWESSIDEFEINDEFENDDEILFNEIIDDKYDDEIIIYIFL